MGDYFKDDEYWKVHINKKLEDDIWTSDYLEHFSKAGKCLDLGCGVGQYSKFFESLGYDVVPTDISDIALAEVAKFNKNVKKADMREKLPFKNEDFDLVFANLSIHYFSDNETQKLMSEINRILKKGGMFVGSVNGLEGYESIKETATEIEHHYWQNKGKMVRLFDGEDLEKYLSIFKLLKIEKKETIRFEHKKNYYIFFAKKQ